MGCIVLNFWSLFRSYWGHSEKRELQQSSCERKKSSGSLNREKMVYWVDTMQFKVSSLDQINYTYSYSKMLVKAPQQWNSLPSDTRHTQPTQAFKTALKTHLYKTIPQVTSNSVFLLPPPPTPYTFALRHSYLHSFCAPTNCSCGVQGINSVTVELLFLRF